MFLLLAYSNSMVLLLVLWAASEVPSNWFHHIRQLSHELWQIAHKTIQSLYALHIFWLWHLGDCMNLFWVWFQALLCYEVAHVYDRATAEFQLVGIQFYSYLFTSLKELLRFLSWSCNTSSSLSLHPYISWAMQSHPPDHLPILPVSCRIFCQKASHQKVVSATCISQMECWRWLVEVWCFIQFYISITWFQICHGEYFCFSESNNTSSKVGVW